MINIMNKDSTRPYKSKIRNQQKQRTRTRILEGLIQVMAEGMAEISIPAVATASGVSIPTIYRYFSTKQELVQALPNYLAQKIGTPTLPSQPSLDDYLKMIQAFYSNAEAMDESMRAAAMSEAAMNLRHTTRPERLQMVEYMLLPVMTDLSAGEQEKLRNVVLVLASSAVIRAFTDYLDLSWQEAADHAVWAIQTIVKGATATPPDTGEEA